MFAAAALVIVAGGLPMLTYTVYSAIESSEPLGEPLALASDPRVWSYIAVIILGLSLFIGSSFRARTFQAFRKFGLDR